MMPGTGAWLTASAMKTTCGPRSRACVRPPRQRPSPTMLEYEARRPYRGGGAAKSAPDVSKPAAKASAAPLISDCACARATSARAAASLVCAEAASVSVPTPCAYELLALRKAAWDAVLSATASAYRRSPVSIWS